MTRYVISDLHLDHRNIIEYCNRPFESLEEMNTTLIENWNRVVDPSDTVLYLGDLAMASHGTAVDFANRLNGSLILVEGNHDDINAETAPFPVVNACDISCGKYHFHCAHWPEKAHDEWEWLLYGHHHNNDVVEYPFIDPERNRVNVSAELLAYTPLPLRTVTDLLDRGERIERVTDVFEAHLVQNGSV